ncbi:MAG TPA: hypothetical protein VNJ07_03110, partial [Chitinophagales bacterium]|nr:hypothetical protein [Chitinophagales bacterium]
MKKIILIISFFLIAPAIYAQTETEISDTAKTEKPKKQKKYKTRKHIRAANRMMAKGNIYAASD